MNWRRFFKLIFIPIFIHHCSPYCTKPTRIALAWVFQAVLLFTFEILRPRLASLIWVSHLCWKWESKLMFSSFDFNSLRIYIYNLVKKWTGYFPLNLALLSSLLPLSVCLYQEQTLIEPCYVSNFVYWASITNRNLLVKLLTLISESSHTMWDE